jgi:hypothetical protein
LVLVVVDHQQHQHHWEVVVERLGRLLSTNHSM